VRTEIHQLTVRQDSLRLLIERQNRLVADTRQTTEGQFTNLQGNFSQQLRNIEVALERLTELAGQNSRDIAGIRDQLALIGRAQRGAPVLDSGSGVRPGETVPSASPDSLFAAALEPMEQGALGTARRGFEQFLTTYPAHPLAPSARFHLADILVQEGRLDEALEAFLEIRADFPTDPKVPEALYRAALIHIELGSPDEARGLLRIVINTDAWSDSDWAEMAQQKLDELGP
jgi:TolA-binding protein